MPLSERKQIGGSNPTTVGKLSAGGLVSCTLLIVSLLLNGSSCTIPSLNSTVTPGEDSYALEVTSQYSQLQIDGLSSSDISIKVKKNNAYIDKLPDGWTITANHSFGGADLIIPQQESNSYSGTLEGREIAIIEMAPLNLSPNSPVTIKCQVEASRVALGDVVRLEVKDANHNLLQAQDYYVNLSDTVFEFTWNSWLSSLPGTYFVAVKIGTVDNNSVFKEKYSSNSVNVYVAGSINSETTLPFTAGLAKLSLIAPAKADHRSSDRITINLKEAEGDIKVTNGNDPLEITFISPSLWRTQASAIPSFSLTATLDAQPAELAYNGSNGNITVTAYKGDAIKEVSYLIDGQTKAITVSTREGAVYSINYGEALYSDAGSLVLGVMEAIIEESYAQIGITGNGTEIPTISQDLGNISINITDDGDIRIYTLSDQAGTSYTFEFDKVASTLKAPTGVTLESVYSIDPEVLDIYLAGLDQASLPTAAGIRAGVAANGLSEDAFDTLVGFVVVGPTVLLKTVSVIGDLIEGYQESLYPYEYAGPVTISYIYPGADYSLLSAIDGTAAPYARVKIYRSNETTVLAETTAYGNGEWSIRNASIPLNSGENQLKAVAYSDAGGESESGDIFINTTEPFFALFSPATRQIAWGDFTANDHTYLQSTFAVLGMAQEGANITINVFDQKDRILKEIYTENSNSEWIFGNKTREWQGNEGSNEVRITVTRDIYSKEITRQVTVAYKFSNSATGKNYVCLPGDLLFVSKKNDGPFDIIPKEPDHNGFYIGSREVVEASWQKGVIKQDIFDGDNKDYSNGNFMYVAQPLKLINQVTREAVARKSRQYVGNAYDWPFLAAFINLFSQRTICPNILGHYNGRQNGFYCSELGYYVWEETIGESRMVATTGMDKARMLWPYDNPAYCPLLPAKLGESMMYERSLEWYE